MIMNMWIASLFSLPAAAFYAMSIKAPMKSVPIAGVCGLLGQLVYAPLTTVTNEYVSVFAATLTVCVLSEICSRVFKTPATVISYPALTPLVPGLMLYNAMISFSQNDYFEGAVRLISTVIYAGCMAVAITAAAVFAKRCLTPIFAKIRKRKSER